ncbi:MAG: hypothetical protein N2578_06070 [Bdellovibrionaceae bacterium]|nr:hypothetical protein [Pseudobdellovibrionaceae bacterium]
MIFSLVPNLLMPRKTLLVLEAGGWRSLFRPSLAKRLLRHGYPVRRLSIKDLKEFDQKIPLAPSDYHIISFGLSMDVEVALQKICRFQYPRNVPLQRVLSDLQSLAEEDFLMAARPEQRLDKDLDLSFVP